MTSFPLLHVCCHRAFPRFSSGVRLLPEIKVFDDLVSTFSVLTPPREHDSQTAIAVVGLSAEREFADLTEEPDQPPPQVQQPLILWYRTGLALPLEAFLEKWTRTLAALGHPTSPSLSLTTLVLCVARIQLAGQTVTTAALNAQAAGCEPGTIYQLVVVDFQTRWEDQVQLGEFKIGPFPTQLVKGFCEHVAVSDVFERVGRYLEGRFAVQGAPTATHLLPVLLDTDLMLKVIADGPDGTFYRLVDEYFHRIADVSWERFFERVERTQHAVVSIGGDYLDERALRSRKGNQRLAFVRLDEGIAWAVSSGIYDIPFTEPSFNTMIYYRVGMADLAALNQFRPAIETFASFVFRAQRHRLDGSGSDAFLHFMIALDLIFGGHERIGEQVSRRAAMIAHHSLGEEYEAARDHIKKLYNARSRYVHNGTAPRFHDIVRAERVCRRIVACLLSVGRKLGDRISFDTFVGHVDHMISQVENIRQPIPTERYSELGILNEPIIFVDDELSAGDVAHLSTKLPPEPG